MSDWQQQVGEPTVQVCYRHPGRETYVRCVRCDRPICPDCMNEASVGFQCPDCVRQGNQSVRPARTAFGGSQAGVKGYMTISLIAANVLVFLLSLAYGGVGSAVGQSVIGGGVTELHLWGGVIPALRDFPGGPVVDGVAAGDYYRLITAMFIHFGITHLLLNMWALWILGRYLEQTVGPLRFLGLYLVAGLGGNVAVYVLGSPGGLSAGASTAIFGLFAAVFFVNRKLRLDNSGIVVLIVLNLGFTFLIPNISILGHLGGLVTGAVVGFGLAYAPRERRSLVQALVVGGAFVILMLVTLARTAALTG